MVANACPQKELLKGEAALQISDSKKCLDPSAGLGTGSRAACRSCAQVEDYCFTSDTAWSALSSNQGGLESSGSGGKGI